MRKRTRPVRFHRPTEQDESDGHSAGSHASIVRITTDEGPVHRHDLDNILVQITGDRMAVVPEPDTGGPYREYLEADVVPGQHFYVDRGGIERALNIGKEPYYEILIELKD